MIYFQLFWTFFKIGLFTIGGGYAMIPLISSEVIANSWLSEEMLINFIAISESTPGPFAINIATFVGVEEAGIFGGICSTFGVVLPSLIIIMLIAAFFTKFTEKQTIKDAFFALRPAVIGLIFFAFFNLTRQTVFSQVSITSFQSFKNTNFVGLILLVILFTISQIPIKKKGIKKKIHPALLIVLSALSGILVYGVIL